MVKTLPCSAGGASSVPGQTAKIPHASGPNHQKVKQKQYCNKFNKAFKNGPHQKNLKKTTHTHTHNNNNKTEKEMRKIRAVTLTKKLEHVFFQSSPSCPYHQSSYKVQHHSLFRMRATSSNINLTLHHSIDWIFGSGPVQTWIGIKVALLV